MPIGIFATGTGSGTGSGRPWQDDGTVLADIYVNNNIGDDTAFDGTSPTIGAGTAGPFATLEKALSVIPVQAAIDRTVHLANTGIPYVLPDFTVAVNRVLVQGATSVNTGYTISSLNTSNRSNGLDLTVSAGMTVDALRGSLVQLTSGSMNGTYGWIYGNDATDIGMSQDTDGTSVFAVPGLGDTLNTLDIGVQISTPNQHTITQCVDFGFEFVEFIGAGSIVAALETDNLTYRYCKFSNAYYRLNSFGQTLLQCSYIACSGDAAYGILQIGNSGILKIQQGTVLDGIGAGLNNRIKARYYSNVVTNSEVVFKDTGSIEFYGANVVTENTLGGEHTWRFIDANGLKGNTNDTSSGGHWDLPVCFGNILETYFLTGTHGLWGRLAAFSNVTTTSVTNAVSADNGASAIADAADYTHFSGGTPAGIGNSMSPSSIEGVYAYGQNINFVAADSIIITGNDGTNEVLFGESHSGDTTNPHNTKQIKTYQVSNPSAVPAAGTLYLGVGDVPTSSVPIIMDYAGKLRGAWIGVDAADGSRSYTLEILKGVSVVETLILPAGTSEISTSSLTTTVAPNDKIAVRLVRSTGSGKSLFNAISAGFDLLEDPQ